MSTRASSDQTVAQQMSTPATSAEEMYQTYNRQHRLRLAHTISQFLFFTLVGLIVAGTILNIVRGVFATNPLQATVFIGVGFVLSAILGLGNWLSRQQKLLWSTGIVTSISVIGTSVLSIFANYLVVTVRINTQLGFLSLTVGILVAGFLGTIEWVIATVVFLNVYSILAMFVILPYVLGQHAIESVPLAVIILIVQWVIGVLMIIGQVNYLQTIRDLCDAEIAYARAQQLDELKDQFISSVNHELRNPIMAMMNYVTILKQRHEVMPVERRTQALEALEGTGKRVIQLVGSILDIRQMAEHLEDFESQSVPIYATLMTASTLIDPLEARLTERKLDVDIPQDLAIWGNEMYLQQILINLLSNAVKYSPPGTPIAVYAHATPDTGNSALANAMIEIVVRDQGFGIPPAQIPLLFNRFVRLQRDLTSRTVGNGLGLYLCKVLTEAMGGHIWIESTGVAGEGSAFHVILPQKPAYVLDNTLAVTQKRAAIAVSRSSRGRTLATLFARMQQRRNAGGFNRQLLDCVHASVVCC